ncbi:MAG: hypothetical protein ACI89L_002203 [Phycisphaerales bacterium]|jgi:hypothetical protein
MRAAIIVFVMASFTVGSFAQIGTSPPEREFPTPMGGVFMAAVLRSPHSLGEIDVATDREAALLKGDVRKVSGEMVVHGQSQRILVDLTMISESQYDDCGNLTQSSLTLIQNGRRESLGLYEYSNSYADGSCVRIDVDTTLSSGDQSREFEGELNREDDGGLVSADFGFSGVRLDRETEGDVIAKYLNTPMGEVVDVFDAGTGLLKRSKSMFGTFTYVWAGNREYVISKDGTELYKVTLGDHGNMVRQEYLLPNSIPAGKLHLREYDFDETGNWTEMRHSSAKELDGTPVLQTVMTRVLTYGEADGGVETAPSTPKDG